MSHGIREARGEIRRLKAQLRAIGQAVEVAQRVIALRQAHPIWGKERMAAELAKANG
ncbi:hypothetical protein EKD04_012500 [Chloroflexales bacterium ZM16-3]|nr:hypothetical protein [Chloroflexales bacterium ZM16-3]